MTLLQIRSNSVNNLLLSGICKISHHKSNTVADMMVLFSAPRLEVTPLNETIVIRNGKTFLLRKDNNPFPFLMTIMKQMNLKTKKCFAFYF